MRIVNGEHFFNLGGIFKPLYIPNLVSSWAWLEGYLKVEDVILFLNQHVDIVITVHVFCKYQELKFQA